jgi:type III pantothenate kinase
VRRARAPRPYHEHLLIYLQMSNLLVVDVGNTNVVLGIYRDDDLIGSWRLATARERTADEYGILTRQLIGDSASSLDGAIVSSVVPPLNTAFAGMIKQHFGIEALFVEPGVKTGIAIHVDNPQEVGADRIVNCVAAFERYGGPSIIVDFGTATTFDVVTVNAEYVGGVIAPGLNISAEALFARASRLPRVDIRRPPTVIGTNTVVNMQSGLYFGYLGLVDGILARMKSELPPLKKIVATGGLATLLAPDSEYIDEVRDDLTLEGLKIIYDRNRGKTRSRAR